MVGALPAWASCFGGIDLRQAIPMGCAQALALIPGTSRSGVTLTAALWLGLSRRVAAKFSFLLSVPIILGAATLKMNDLIEVYRISGMGHYPGWRNRELPVCLPMHPTISDVDPTYRTTSFCCLSSRARHDFIDGDYLGKS